VNVNWNGDGWNVKANSVENPDEWNAGNSVFSRNSLIFSRLFGGSFYYISYADDFVFFSENKEGLIAL
jgi:hypothetical protein